MGEETVDIDTERYVNLSAMYQCRRDDPRRRRKVRRDGDAIATHTDTLSSQDVGIVTVSNTTTDKSTAATMKPASGTVSGGANQPSGANRAMNLADQAEVDDRPRYSRQRVDSVGATAGSATGSSTTTSNNSIAAATTTAAAAATSASVDSDDDIDKKLKARMARFVSKKQNRQPPTTDTAAVAEGPSAAQNWPDRSSETPTFKNGSSSGGTMASTTSPYVQEDGPTTLDLPASNDDQMEASTATSSSSVVSSTYNIGEDRDAAQRSLKRKTSTELSESTASSDVKSSTGTQSTLSDFFKRSPAKSSRPSSDSTEDRFDNSLSVADRAAASSDASQSWYVPHEFLAVSHGVFSV